MGVTASGAKQSFGKAKLELLASHLLVALLVLLRRTALKRRRIPILEVILRRPSSATKQTWHITEEVADGVP
jgi:hypothetical protein